MAAEREGGAGGRRAEARGFWSGTITFGLVSVPVDLYPAVRSHRVALRMLSPEGRPLQRRYYCSADGRALGRDDIVRGYPWGEDSFVVVTDEELENLAPRKSRDIDLRRFVRREEIEPRLLERPYILAPAGESTKAYHLLAETMERTGRAGIATFVMRGKEYLAAIFAEGGLLRAATMRFMDELRSPEDIGLPEPRRAKAERRRAMQAALDALASPTLDDNLLRDEDSARLRELAEAKRAESRDLVEVAEVPPEGDEETADVIDIMSVLKRRIVEGGGPSAGARERRGGRGRAAPQRRAEPRRTQRSDPLAGKSKKELYERAKALDVPGRSSMSREELLEAIRRAG